MAGVHRESKLHLAHAALRGDRVRLGVGALVVLVLLAAVVAVISGFVASPGSGGAVPARGAVGSSSASPFTSVPPSIRGDSGLTGGGSSGSGDSGAAAGAVVVHVLGQVVKPGVYRLSGQARVDDAVRAAGGLTPQADQGALNLARRLSDGEQVYVLALGEQRPEMTAADSGEAASGGTEGASAGKAAGASAGKININTASASQLETLPRIGPALAGRIIDYRGAHGPFTSVDDLLSVSGIGAKMLDGLRDAVTV